jgi:hypothetical protein
MRESVEWKERRREIEKEEKVTVLREKGERRKDKNEIWWKKRKKGSDVTQRERRKRKDRNGMEREIDSEKGRKL